MSLMEQVYLPESIGIEALLFLGNAPRLGSLIQIVFLFCLPMRNNSTADCYRKPQPKLLVSSRWL